MMYDSSLGGCLTALHSSCPDDVVKLTATPLMNVLPLSMWRTKSQELKVRSSASSNLHVMQAFGSSCETFFFVDLCSLLIWRLNCMEELLRCIYVCIFFLLRRLCAVLTNGLLELAHLIFGALSV